MERQRLHGVWTRRVDVHLLAESVTLQQVGARPTAWQCARCGVELERHFVPGLRDDELIVRLDQQRQHTTFARVVAGEDFPWRRRRYATVVVAWRIFAVGTELRREPSGTKYGGPRISSRRRETVRRHRLAHLNLVPVDSHARRQTQEVFAGSQPTAQVDGDGLRPSNRDSNRHTKRTPTSVGGAHVQSRFLGLQTSLVCSYVVAREGVVGPTREQQCLWRLCVSGVTQFDGQRMWRRVAANGFEGEVVGILPIEVRDSHGHVMAVLVGHTRRRMQTTNSMQTVGFGLDGHSFIGKHLHVGWMSDGRQPKPIEEQHFLEFVRHAKTKPTIHGLQLIVADAHVLHRVRMVVDARSFPVTHLAATEEVGDKLKALAIPGEEKWTRRWLAIELFDQERRRQSSWQRFCCRRCARRGRCRHGGDLCLHDARRPQDARNLGAWPRAEPKHDVGGCNGRECRARFETLGEPACADLHLRADAGAVSHTAAQPHAERSVPTISTVLKPPCRGTNGRHQVGGSVAVGVRNGQCTNGGRIGWKATPS